MVIARFSATSDEEDVPMPEKKTIRRASRAKDEGKSPSTQAGAFVQEEIEHVREGKHGARSARQAIAIGLSKARRAGIDVPPKKKASTGKDAGARKPSGKKASSASTSESSRTRSSAAKKALEREGHAAGSHQALSKQARSAARKRTSASRSASAKKAARTKGRSTTGRTARRPSSKN